MIYERSSGVPLPKGLGRHTHTFFFSDALSFQQQKLTGDPQIEKMLPGAANKLVKYLGPAGSAASSVSNFINAAEAIENGNVDGAVFQGLQGIGNAASAAGGAGLLLGLATGPLMIGGGILAFGAWLGEELFGDTPEENLLESLDLER